MNSDYQIISPDKPAMYLMDMVLEWPVYREMTQEQIINRFMLPAAARKVLFLKLGKDDRAAATFNRLPEKVLMHTIKHGPGPVTWQDYAGGLLCGMDVVTSPGVKARRYAPAFRRALAELGVGIPGERVVWCRYKGDRVCWATLLEPQSQPRALAIGE